MWLICDIGREMVRKLLLLGVLVVFCLLFFNYTVNSRSTVKIYVDLVSFKLTFIQSDLKKKKEKKKI
jgi:hypothetical protein